jgi:hypothetical protein
MVQKSSTKYTAANPRQHFCHTRNLKGPYLIQIMVFWNTKPFSNHLPFCKVSQTRRSYTSFDLTMTTNSLAHLLIRRPWHVTDGLVASISTWRLDSSQDRPCRMCGGKWYWDWLLKWQFSIPLWLLFHHCYIYIYIYILIIKPTRCRNFSNFLGNKILHVSDSSSVHHQEFFNLHIAMVYVTQVCW